MKKVLLLLAVFIAVMAPSFAAPALCTNVTLNQLLAGGIYAAEGCQVSDKIFSGFAYSGDVAATNIAVAFQANGPIPAGATIQFTPNNGTNWAALTNLSFNTRIDTTLCPTCVFVSVLDQIFTPPTPNSNSGTFSHPGGVPANLNVSGSSPATLSAQSALPGSLTTINTTFTQTGGSTLQSLSSSFNQNNVPEPSTFALLGGGLVAFALYRRKRA